MILVALQQKRKTKQNWNHFIFAPFHTKIMWTLKHSEDHSELQFSDAFENMAE